MSILESAQIEFLKNYGCPESYRKPRTLPRLVLPHVFLHVYGYDLVFCFKYAVFILQAPLICDRALLAMTIMMDSEAIRAWMKAPELDTRASHFTGEQARAAMLTLAECIERKTKKADII